jgi:hypothetical protein
MKISQAVGMVIAGTLILQIADFGISAYVRDRDIAKNQRIRQQQSPAEIDRSNRELAEDDAFLHDNLSLEKPTSQKLSKTPTKFQHK